MPAIAMRDDSIAPALVAYHLRAMTTLNAGSRWQRWDPHIHAPGTLRNNQFGEDWDSYIAAIEAARPAPVALGITDYFTMRSYERVLALRAEGRLASVPFVFANIEIRLTIETKHRQGINLQSTRPIHYYLTVDELTKILISSSGDVLTQDLQSQSFSVTSTSSGDLSIGSLECTSLGVTISSSGNVEILGGQVQRQNITISSSGEYRAQDLASVETEVTLTSTGTATIRVSDRLGGRLSSSGNVYYLGNPEVSVRTTSSGRAVQRND